MRLPRRRRRPAGPRWRPLPPSPRLSWRGWSPPAPAVLTGAALVFGYGTVVHVVQLAAGGLDPYPTMPTWLAVYFVALTVLDATAVVLLVRRPAAGLVFGAFVLVTDALANGWANYVVDQADGVTPGRIGQAVISALAVILIVALPRTLGALSTRTPPPG